MSGSALVIHGNALHLPFADHSVDLVVTSPPYHGLRSYRDNGVHYEGQIGSEAHPQEFLEALWTVMREVWRVLKPAGSCFINLGDRRSGSGGHNNSGISSKSTLQGNGHVGGVGKAGPQKIKATLRNAPDRYNQAAFGRTKSKMLLPHRFAIGCEDGLADPEGKGWIVRQDIVWSKLNGLPESVTDRCRDSHEYLFHLVKQGDYFAAVDEVRTPQAHFHTVLDRKDRDLPNSNGHHNRMESGPLGSLPSSVWPLASEPLLISPDVKAHYDLPDHFAAFSTELVRRVILGWSPSGICTACGKGRRPVVAKEITADRGGRQFNPSSGNIGVLGKERDATITGYACACTPRTSHRGKRGDWKEGREVQPEANADDWHSPGASVPRKVTPGGRGVKIGPPPSTPMWEYDLDGWTPPPTRPAVVLDVFGGSGTTAGVARALGRFGVGVDLSHDYCRLAHYLIHHSSRFAKVHARTNAERQGTLIA